MRVGIVCEGTTDFAVLEALAIAFGQATECVLLQPDVDRLQSGQFSAGTGWQAVRKFLRENGLALQIGVFDAFVIQIDASVRKSHELTLRPAKPDEPALAPLCDEVKAWLSGGFPDGAIVTLPREETEAWPLAALTNVARPEDLPDPADDLVARQFLRRRPDGTINKIPEHYRELAEPLVRFARRPKDLARVPELERFLGKLRTRAHVVRKARRRRPSSPVQE